MAPGAGVAAGGQAWRRRGVQVWRPGEQVWRWEQVWRRVAGRAHLLLVLREHAVEVRALLLGVPLELLQLGAQLLDHARVAAVRLQLVTQRRDLLRL